MALTDNADVYGALHEDGINRLVDHLVRKRPSLFNYGTARLAEAVHALADGERIRGRSRRQLPVCRRIDYAPELRDEPWRNPLLTVEDPFPVLGTNGLVALDYCYQVVEFEVDFAPDTLDLGVESQQFAAHVEVCAGLACPDEDEHDEVLAELDEVYAYLEERDMSVEELTANDALMEELGLPVVPEPEAIHCFCLDVSVVGSVDLVDRPTVTDRVEIPQSPRFRVHDVRIDDVEGGEFAVPKGMLSAIECYIHQFIQLGLLPSVRDAVASITVETLRMEVAIFHLDLSNVRARITFPETSAIPNNPAVEEDEFRAWLDLDVWVQEEA